MFDIIFNMKKIKIIGIFLIFGLSVISHFMYVWFPNDIFSILFPVNESIWEHMKLIVTPVLFFCIFENIFYKKKNILVNNFILSYSISTLLGIVIYLILYLPIHYIIGHNIFISIGLLFIVFMIIEIISYYIMKYKNIKYSRIIGLVIIVIMYIIFGYLTYNPPKNDLFYDTSKNIYGIPEKNIKSN